MDPITASGLVASALGVADIAARLDWGLRQLYNDFSGALGNVEIISQQTNTIDLAIREICSIINQQPQTFPISFEAHLHDLISSVHNIVRQMQDHVESVRITAEQSQGKATLQHLFNSAQVKEWGSALTVQIQALMLLLQVAQLYVLLTDWVSVLGLRNCADSTNTDTPTARERRAWRETLAGSCLKKPYPCRPSLPRSSLSMKNTRHSGNSLSIPSSWSPKYTGACANLTGSVN